MFTLIIIRVGLGYTMNDSVSGGGGGGANLSDRGDPRQLQTIGGHSYPLQPVAINVSVSRTHDRASFEGYDHKLASDIESGKAPCPPNKTDVKSNLTTYGHVYAAIARA